MEEARLQTDTSPRTPTPRVPSTARYKAHLVSEGRGAGYIDTHPGWAWNLIGSSKQPKPTHEAASASVRPPKIGGPQWDRHAKSWIA
ncbi:hypothetical protein ARTHRO9AX_80101 [Arthrobacter sp. 9AX]|nr:hypothetical protein ARTHRO9AX_80101 [Arthrobacter sp. 9AX]